MVGKRGFALEFVSEENRLKNKRRIEDMQNNCRSKIENLKTHLTRLYPEN